jgi:putative ABC transport system permease protein
VKFRGIIFANLFRKKIRLILTIGSFTIALVLFGFLATVKTAFSQGVEIAGADRLIVVNRISIIQPLPLKYRDQILRVPGVKSITHDNWFGGIYQDEKNFFPQFVIDVENQRKVFPELVVPEEQWQAFLRDRQGAIAGEDLIKRFGWKIGDRIPIKSTIFGGSNTWEFNLVGVYHATRPQDPKNQFWFQWDHFQEGLPERIRGNAGWFVLKIENPDDAVRISKAIDDQFANSPFETRTATE